MTKYIDAVRLRAEIDRIEEEARKVRVSGTDKEAIGADGKVKLCLKLKSLIDSLQQEQPEGMHFIPLYRLIQKIPSENWNNTVNNYARKLRDCLIKEGYRKDAEVLQGYISYMNGNNIPMATMDEQEQPEVDLEKELEDYARENPTEDAGSYRNLMNIACHFYELGFNTRNNDRF